MQRDATGTTPLCETHLYLLQSHQIAADRYRIRVSKFDAVPVIQCNGADLYYEEPVSTTAA